LSSCRRREQSRVACRHRRVVVGGSGGGRYFGPLGAEAILRKPQALTAAKRPFQLGRRRVHCVQAHNTSWCISDLHGRLQPLCFGVVIMHAPD
jgi:hypothetical protein